MLLPDKANRRIDESMVADSVYTEARATVIAEDFKRIGLSPDYLTFFLSNPSRDLPYHGNQHQLAVALLCYRGGYNHQLDDEERKALLLAALFHDFGYDLHVEDHVNIETAVSSIEAIVNEHNPELRSRVQELIRETVVPRTEPSSISAAILQDADLLMVTQPDVESFLKGLAEERPDAEIDPLFPGEQALNTAWGKRIYGTARTNIVTARLITDPISAVAIGNTHHSQTLSSRGFLVDSSIAHWLELLWSIGYETAFSCGGDRNEVSFGWDRPIVGYIAFPTYTGDQLRALKKAAEVSGRPLEFFSNVGNGFNGVVLRFAGDAAAETLETLIEA